MKENFPSHNEYSSDQGRDKLWTLIETEREATRVPSPDGTRAHFFLPPGFPLPSHLVREDLARIPDDEIIAFSKAHEGALTQEEFDLYNKKFLEIENDPVNLDPLRHALLYYIRDQMNPRAIEESNKAS